MRWSLDALYTSFESEEFQEDFNKFSEVVMDINSWAGEQLTSQGNCIKKIEQYINYSINISYFYNKLASFANLSISTNVRNETALGYMEKLRLKATELTKAEVQFKSFLKDIDNLDELVAESDLLREHSFYLNQIRKSAQYMLSEAEEILISKMANTGSTAWSNLQDKVTATLMVDINIDGKAKQLPLSLVRNLAYDKNQEVRKTAYEAELEAYQKIHESSAAALNGIKGEVLITSGLRGFESPLNESLFKSRMDEETLDAMITAMEEFLPVFHKYYKKKAEILGHGNGLPFYDLFAPIGKVNMSFTYEEAMEFIIKNFRSYSDKLADYVLVAYENDWLDVEPRDGKSGGAFCANLHPIGESRILANFDGSFSNMTTLAHELGHGYHGLNLRDESILNSRYPMPIAETASIFCETIIVNAALKEANDEEALAILESSISDAGQVIVDIYSRFLFESEVFERRKNASLSVNNLNEIMIDAQKKAYGNGLDHDLLHPYMWLNKPHYYSAGLNFYNFPYAFGLLFSKGLYAEYLKRGDNFIEEYDTLLKATGKNTIKDVALRMDIDVHNPEFFRNSLRLIEKDIEKFVELADQ